MTSKKFLLIPAFLLAILAGIVDRPALPRMPRAAPAPHRRAGLRLRHRAKLLSAIFGTNVDVGKGIADLLVTDLVKDGTYSIIERKALDKIMAEQNFSNSNRADPTSAAKLGKLLGVDAILVGSITQFGNETKKTNLGGGGGNWGGFGLGGIGHSNSKANVGIDARLVNVDTGEILAVAEGKGQSSRSSTSCSAAAATGTASAAATPTSAPATSRTPSSAKPPSRPSTSSPPTWSPTPPRSRPHHHRRGPCRRRRWRPDRPQRGRSAGVKVGDQLKSCASPRRSRTPPPAPSSAASAPRLASSRPPTSTTLPPSANPSPAPASKPATPLERGTGGGAAKIEFVLQVEPELRRQAKVDAQPQGRIGGDCPLAAHYISHPRRRHAKILGQTVGRQPKRLHKLGQQNLSGMD
jgi:curli biogenesis system outer membrane secretion channel CsgG